MSAAHPTELPIEVIHVSNLPVPTLFEVGQNGITKIEAFTKPGLHCDLPYFRVWRHRQPMAEFSQHQIVGVYFKQVEEG